MTPIDRELRILADLDAEEGRTVRPGGKENKHRVAIRQTNRVGFNVLMAYLEGRTGFDNTCLEAINFLDHLLREYPSLQYTQIKRSYFARGQQRFSLGSGVEVRQLYLFVSLKSHANCFPGLQRCIPIDAGGSRWS